MARVPVNSSCNLLTQPDVKNPRATVEITVPRYRLNLSPDEADALAADLVAAAMVARGVEKRWITEIGMNGRTVKV